MVPDSVTPPFARANGLQQQANATGQRLREGPAPVSMILPARLEGKGQQPYFWSQLIPKGHALLGSQLRDDARLKAPQLTWPRSELRRPRYGTFASFAAVSPRKAKGLKSVLVSKASTPSRRLSQSTAA